jgi:hypothetical protein
MKIEITKDEYPPKYVGIKGNGIKKMVYRIEGEMGLVWYQLRDFREVGYRWEHFKIIRKAIVKNGKTK